MSNKVAVFNYENNQVRSVAIKGEPWFVLADLCKVLELSNPSKVAQRLDADERSNFKLGRQGKGVIVNESGMYAVILRSDKPQAKSFRKWVTSEVLPSIRKTGKYHGGGYLSAQRRASRKEHANPRTKLQNTNGATFVENFRKNTNGIQAGSSC